MLDAVKRLEASVVTGVQEMEALRPEWMELWRRCPEATPFQSPAWLIPWWRHFGQGQLLTVTLWQEERLVGLAPLFVGDVDGARAVLPIGTGITDYLDALLDPALGAEDAEAIFRQLHDRANLWEVCDLQQLRSSSLLLRAPAPPGWSDQHAVQDACPVLELPGSVEALTAKLPRSTVRHLRANRRRADKVGETQVETVRHPDMKPGLDALFRLHGAAWNARGEPGVLSDPAVQAFHREAAAELQAQGLLRLNLLRLEGWEAAVYYGFIAKGRAYGYLTGFDPEWARLSLGSAVVGWSIEQAVGEGATEFHFLRGQESYKFKWGARERFNYRRTLFGR